MNSHCFDNFVILHFLVTLIDLSLDVFKGAVTFFVNFTLLVPPASAHDDVSWPVVSPRLVFMNATYLERVIFPLERGNKEHIS